MSMDLYREWKSNSISVDPFLSVVIPTYNEEIRILPTVGAVASFISSLGFAWELIISDDGSTDSTVELVRGLGFKNLKVIDGFENAGKGASVRRGVEIASGSLVLFLDADQSTPIEQLPAFISEAYSSDVVIGSRSLVGSQVKNKSAFRKFLSWGLNGFVNLFFRLPFADTQCGFKLFKGDVAKQLFSASKINGFSFDLELLYIAHYQGLKISELAVEWHDAPDSKVSGYKSTLKFLADMPFIIFNRLRGFYRLDFSQIARPDLPEVSDFKADRNTSRISDSESLV